MALQSYKSQALTLGTQQTPALGALTAKASGASSLASRLQQFSNSLGEVAANVAAEDATQTAIKDMEEGKDFHSKSTFSVYGRAYNNAATSTYASQADLQIYKKSEELRLQHQRNPAAYSAAMDGYINEMSAKAPTSELSSTIKISGTKLRNSNFASLAQAKDIRIKQEQVSVFLEDNDIKNGQIINSASSGDNKTAMLLKAGQLEKLKSLVNEGVMSEAQALKIINQSNYDITKGTLLENMKDLLTEPSLENASQMLNSFSEEIPADISPDEHTAIKNDLQRMFNAEVKNRKADTKTAQVNAGLAVDDAIKVLKSGRSPNNIKDVQEALQFATPKKAHEFEVQLQAYEIAQKFNYLSLPEQMAEYNTLEAQGEFSLVGSEVADAVKKNLSERMAKAKSDPISLSVQEGLSKPTPALSVSNGPLALSQILPQRSEMAVANKLEYGEGSYQLFTESEANEYTAYLESPDTSIADKLSFISTIEATVPNDVNSVYRQLRKKGGSIFSTAGSLIREGKPEVARALLRGQVIQKELGDTEGINDLKYRLLGQVGNAMQYAGEGDRKALIDSSVALYLANAEQQGKLDKGLSGGGEKDVIDSLTNGVAQRNGQDFFLPKDVEESDFEDFIDELKASSLPDMQGVSKEDALKIIQNGQLISVGSGEYAIRYSGAFLKDSDGKTFRLTYDIQ